MLFLRIFLKDFIVCVSVCVYGLLVVVVRPPPELPKW